MDEKEFLDVFGKVFEHSPWVAKRAWDTGLDESHDGREALHSLFEKIIRDSSDKEKMALVKSHPCLAAPLPRDQSSAASRNEQQRAGLTSLDDAGRKHFAELNEKYLAKFGFPFILAVEGLGKEEILNAFERRCALDDRKKEFMTALEQVIKIGKLRMSRM